MTWLSQGGRPLTHTEGREHWLTSLLSRTHSVSQHLSGLSLERISLLGGSVNTFIRELPGDHKHSGESSVSLNCVKRLVRWLHIPVLHNVTHIHTHTRAPHSQPLSLIPQQQPFLFILFFSMCSSHFALNFIFKTTHLRHIHNYLDPTSYSYW